MVGKLARWLRVLGLDTAYSNIWQDGEILRIADAEGRIVLTRDTGLVTRRAASVLVESDDYRQQLKQIISTFALCDFRIFSRCLECNVPLESADKESVFERVPPYVYLTQEHFAICPSCKRVFWHGTHTGNMLERLGWRT